MLYKSLNQICDMKKTAFYLLLAITGISCTPYVPFTSEMRQSLQESNINIADVQFYSSKRIVLKRNSVVNKEELQQGELSRTNTRIREKITFSGHEGDKLAGVCRLIPSTALGICFEDGDIYEKSILFDQDKNGKYYITSREVKYDNQYYDVLEGKGAMLLISSNDKKKYETTKRKVKGLYVSQ